ncbi:MAG TPA: VanW family protein [Chloroflexota bacterium]
MARSVRDPGQTSGPERERRVELIRPAERRRAFPRREAQRRLQQKESHWAPIAYAVFLAAVLLIFGVTYTAYAFSKYRGVILPGVYVDSASLSGLTSSQAEKRIDGKLAALYGHPLILEYGARHWEPSRQEIGLEYDISGTVKEAEAVGRSGSFIGDLLDRLPVHSSHTVPLLYRLDEAKLRSYLTAAIAREISHPSKNASLSIKNSHVVLAPSSPGIQLDVGNSEQVVHDSLGSLSMQTGSLRVIKIPPMVTDADARNVQNQVQNFLNHPPVMQLGKRVLVGSPYSFAQMIHFATKIANHRAAIQMIVDSTAVDKYVQWLAWQVDRQPQNAKLSFFAGHVSVTTPRKTGRTLDQTVATRKILAIVSGLKPTARLRMPVAITQPAFDPSNPASLGISTEVGAATTSFVGASTARGDSVATIARSLNNVVIQPGQPVSFNQLVGTGWADQAYSDQETEVNGHIVPGDGGAMQQVATTFLRALYGAGLTLKERHAHRFRLPWYEPPYGYDAVVNPARGWDLVFYNNTGKNLILQTSVQPIRQQISIYVYGPELGWKVAVDSFGRLTKVIKPGPSIERVDPTLPPDQRQQIAWPSKGGTTVLQRTITDRKGNVRVDEIDTTYDPRAAVFAVGSAAATATPQVTTTPTKKGTPRPGANTTPGTSTTAGTGPQPTPTFNH